MRLVWHLICCRVGYRFCVTSIVGGNIFNQGDHGIVLISDAPALFSQVFSPAMAFNLVEKIWCASINCCVDQALHHGWVSLTPMLQ